MKFITRGLLLALVFAGISISKAAQPMTGAFGLKFGEPIDESRLTGEKYSDYLSVNPPRPTSKYQTYEVSLTPYLRKIHSIRASKLFSKAEEADDAFWAELVALESAVGPRDKELDIKGKSKNIDKTARIFCKEGEIMLDVVVDGTKAKWLYVEYVNKEVLRDGLKEKPRAASDKITKAFGYYFGEKFDVSTALEKRPVSAGGYLYVVKPPKPNKMFETYFLVVTPKSHLIAAVWANAFFDSQNEALTKQSLLKTLLEDKYGKSDESQSSDNKFVIVKDEASITVSTFPGQGEQTVLLAKYTNDKLQQLFMKELKEDTSANADKSGL